MKPKTKITVSIVFIASFLLIQGCAPYRVYPPEQRTFPQPVPRPTKQHQPTEQRRPYENTIRTEPGSAPETSRATKSIIRQAEKYTSAGNYALAAATLERGLRMNPKSGTLWSELASIRLLQGRYMQAQSLAEKSNSLAAGNNLVKRKNSQIIDQARRQTNSP